MSNDDALLDMPNLDEETFKFQVGNSLSQRYRIFIPKGHKFSSNSRVIVCVHGISRRSKEQIQLLSKGARENSTVLIAPLFDNHYHPSYQRHKAGIDGLRSDEVLNNIITDVEKRFKLRIEQFDLFGFSGGAQFSHRYALRYPKKISKLICCAAGWYTFPDLELPFPHGLGCNHDLEFMLETVDERLVDFLEIPITIAVGEYDKHSDSSLNRTKKVNKQQGFNRIERAVRWTNSLLEQSERLETEAQLRFILLPKCGHSFTECVSYGMLSSYVF